MKKPGLKRLGTPGAWLLLIVFATMAQAQSLSLMAPAIANDNGVFTARFGIAVEALPILKGELEDGAELVLKCKTGLFENNEYWLDSQVFKVSFESTISYDRIAKEFVLTLPGKDKPLRNENIETLLKEGWSSLEARLGPWDKLERGENYTLRLTTALQDADAPEGLSKIIYFWSWDAGSNNTFLLNFTF